MSLFDSMLGSSETLFRDSVALDYDYMPKLIPYREKEQMQIAMCIKPLFQKRNARNIFIYGTPGVGKTVACRHILDELEEQTDEIIPIYINCWQINTSYKIALELCEKLGYKFTQNKKTEDLFKIAQEIINKRSAVIILDEVDKLSDFDIAYSILEGIYRKTVILITNYKQWISDLDERIKSRLTAEMLEFKPYNEIETKGILQQRLKFGFMDNVWEDDAFNLATTKAAEIKDVRSGLYILKEAGNAAEDMASRKITIKHVEIAIKKLTEFSIKNKNDLEDDTKLIMQLIDEMPNAKISDLHKKYEEKNGQISYRTFFRRIQKLSEDRFIEITKISGGKEGSYNIVKKVTVEKKLTDF